MKNNKIQIYRPGDCEAEMLKSYKTGKIKGTTTYNAEIDNAWTWRLEEFNIWSGYGNEGRFCRLKK